MTNPDHAAAGDTDLQALYEQAPCGYVSVLDDGSIVRANETFLRWSGYERSALLGTPWQDLLPIGDRILFNTHTWPQLQLAGAVSESAVDIVGADRARRPAFLNATRTPADDASPAITRIIVFSARERRAYEKDLLAALRQAEAAEAGRLKAEADLHYLATHDEVTSVASRTGFMTQLSEKLQTGDRLAVLVINIGQWNDVNDSLGRAAGDALLQGVVTALMWSVRDGAVLGRLTSDDFVLAEAVSDAAAGEALAARLLELLNEPIGIDGLDVVAGAGIGIAVSSGAERDAEALVRKADVAMFRVKTRGRGGWVLHDERQPYVPADNRLRLLDEVRRGIERDEFVLHYQPQIEADSGWVLGVEALVRWQHPSRGLLPPGDFIDLVEQSDLIAKLGTRLLNAAVDQAAAWNAGGAALAVSVNLSARQLVDPALVTLVAQALKRSELAPELLTLEITETALTADIDAAIGVIEALNATGVKISIDDFGTGYSSFTYLKRLPVDELKVDQSFVQGLGTDPADTAIVTSCIQLAHSLGIRAVAEGVETPLQQQILDALGCDVLQGYLLGRPAAPERIRAVLDAAARVPLPRHGALRASVVA